MHFDNLSASSICLVVCLSVFVNVYVCLVVPHKIKFQWHLHQFSQNDRQKIEMYLFELPDNLIYLLCSLIYNTCLRVFTFFAYICNALFILHFNYFISLFTNFCVIMQQILRSWGVSSVASRTLSTILPVPNASVPSHVPSVTVHTACARCPTMGAMLLPHWLPGASSLPPHPVGNRVVNEHHSRWDYRHVRVYEIFLFKY